MLSQLRQKLPNVRGNIPLAPFTSFNIGGPAKYFLEAKTENEVVETLVLAKEMQLKTFILGGGTNILISDKGIDGLVLRLDNDFIEFHESLVHCGAGISLQKLIDESIEKGLSGLETMSGIGGTVGGAIRGNAGAFGQSIGDRVKEVSAYYNGGIKKFNHDECQFSYRESIFKKISSTVISVSLKLEFGDKAELRKKADEIIKTRNSRYNVNWQCAGCVFKNVDLNEVKIDKARVLKALDITQKEYDEVTKFGKLPVSFITDKLGLKGKKIGGAQIAQEHGAFILNVGGAKAEDIIMLMSIIKTRVRNELGIQLESEIELVGF